MIRLFAAIPVPDDIGQGLARRQQGLAGAHWRPLDSLHLTLRFFGNISEDKADDVDAELGAVGGAPLDLALAGVGEFGAGGESHAVWAGVEANDALRRLAARCESAARRAGLAPETRVWRPHVTLAYLTCAEPVRVATWVQSHNLLKSPSFHVDAFGLYSSWRADRGHTYRLERRYALT